jgi:geranylgeranyl pyrophosphate synthase
MFQIDTHQSGIARINEVQCSILAGYRDIHGENALLEICDYALAARGKMMRGQLLLEACRSVGGAPEELLFAAAGIEYGHLASLIHDDLIDRDELRRGQGTIWKMYSDESAILSGDMFIFSAFHSLSLSRHTVPSERVARAFEVLSLACVELCLGQASEAQLSGKCSTGPADYLGMIRQKTGSLIRASVETGAVLGGGNEEQISALREYGDYLGIAFQIVDDLLPYISTEKTLQKPTKSDIKNRRITLPIIYALESGSTTEREMLRRIFEEGYLANELDEAEKIVIGILQDTRALERTRQEAIYYQQEALEQLECLPVNTGRTYLANIAELAVNRSY